jgi:succinyl-CoA synthetase beta subunit
MPEDLVFKAQLEIGGRGKAGGILFGKRGEAVRVAGELFSRTIRGLTVERILVEERLSILQEYYLSIMVDRSSREPLILFALSGGVDIETLAQEQPDAVRKIHLPPLLEEVPPFALRSLLKRAPKEIAPVIQNLYRVFREKDAILAEINPLAATPQGIIAADVKLIIDDNALFRQGITQNRDLTPREREAEKHGFSYVELEGSIGVIGNGAGLTMATLDLIDSYQGKAANFLDVGGGADQARVIQAIRLVAGMPSVRVILVNLLGGITRCDDVARGIIESGVSQPIVVRLAGTNEEEGRRLLREHGYEMYDTMEQAVRAAVEVT